MNSILGLVGTAVGVFVFLFVHHVVGTLSKLLKMRFRSGRSEVVPRAEAGLELLILDAAMPVLEAEGFRYVMTRRSMAITASPSMAASHCDVYFHPELDVHAEVNLAAAPTPRRVFDVILSNDCVDGTSLSTVNGISHQLLPSPANSTIVEADATSFKLQLEAHLSKRSAMTAPRTDPADALSLTLASTRAMFPRLVDEGKAYVRREPGDGTIYGLRPAAALDLAWRIILGPPVPGEDAKAGAIVPPTPPDVAPAVWAAAERLAFARDLCSADALLAPRWLRWSVFSVSATAFVALGAWWWGITFALVIAAVIAVHEAGHWAAMRLARFRDVQVFFVPGFGGATSGEKHDARPLTHLAVYLAGPVPGLLLALGVMAWMMSGQAGEGAWWYALLAVTMTVTLLINLVNLLPVMPLDGGRVVDLFVLARLPWLRFAFTASSALLIGWSGFASDAAIVQGFSLLLLLGLPHHYRVARVASGLRRGRHQAPLANVPFAQAAERLYDFLAAPAFASWSVETRLRVGETVLPHFLGRAPSPKETTAGLVLYLSCLLLPVAALAYLAARQPDRLSYIVMGSWSDVLPGARPAARLPAPVLAPGQAARTLRAHNDAQLATASTPTQQRAMLARLVEEAGDEEEYEEGLRLSRLLYAQTAALPHPAREHAEAGLKVATMLMDCGCEGGVAEAAPLIRKAEADVRLRLARLANEEDTLLLAQVLQVRVNGDDPAMGVPGRQELVALLAAYPAAAGTSLPAARVALARELDQARQAGDAREQLGIAAADYAAMGDKAGYQRQTLLIDTAWFLTAHQRGPEALQLLQPLLVKSGPVAAGDDHFRRDAHLLAAFQSRTAGNWQQVEAYTSVIESRPRKPSAKWYINFYRATPLAMPNHDVRAALMLLEAQRALGRSGEADALAASLRRQYGPRPGASLVCRYDRRADDAWRQSYRTVLAAIESRELGCVPGRAAPP